MLNEHRQAETFSCVLVVLMLIACGVFTGLRIIYGSSNWFGYSFYLAWVGFLFNTITAIVAIVGAARKYG